MSKTKKSTIDVRGEAITVLSTEAGDYISLTDMLRAKDGEFFISDWLRNRNTVEFLGIWESVFNPDFNYGEFAAIRNQAGLNSYKISVKEWVEKTKAIGLKATAGRYGGTYAHPDIAFEFGMWISPEFKIYLVREFRRLKDDENRRLSLSWNLNRTLSKLNYRIHTDAIKTHLIPPEVTPAQAAAIIHSLKYRTVSQFWLILFHEIAHLVLHITDPGDVFEDYDDQATDPRETAADDWARDTLVFSDALIAFQARNEKPEPWQIQQFAQAVKVHPAIAAEVFNKKAGREVIKYGYLKIKGLFPHISEAEAEELWKRNELVVS